MVFIFNLVSRLQHKYLFKDAIALLDRYKKIAEANKYEEYLEHYQV